MKRCALARRKGSVVVLVAVLLPVFFILAALAIDLGRIGLARSRLQAAADAAALAAVEELPYENNALVAAQKIGGFNLAEESGIVANDDVECGIWSGDTLTFAPSAPSQANAVRVTARLSEENGNALSLFFGGFVGILSTDVSASAVATRDGSGIGIRFLIDDEMIDKDVPAIEDLAYSLGRDVEELVTPRGFNQGKEYGDGNWVWEDNFLDLPAGVQLSLPTGQGTDYDNNDAGMFDITHPAFPFTDDASLRDFVMYSESGNDPSKWGTDLEYILDQLDPLYGVIPVTDDSQYPSFVDPDYTHISPVTFSDISTLDQNGGVPQINAKGLRRGLIAFKIIDVGVDVDGGGSVLPELIIETVDPATTSLDDIKATSGGGGSRLRIVQ